MVWNKTPIEKELAIVEQIRNTDKLDYEIAEEFGVSANLVSVFSRRHLSKEERRSLWNRRARRSKLGSNNPMYGKKGKLHHNSVDSVTLNGYRTVFAPDWWAGKLHNGSRIYEHIYVYCKHHNLSKLPDNHVVHHIDHNVNNNDISNLELLSISDHVKLHWRERKEQRLSHEGVGNSVPEAQSIQKG